MLRLRATMMTIVEQEGEGGEDDKVGALLRRRNDCREAHGMLEGSVLLQQEGSSVEVTINMLLEEVCDKVRWGESTTSATASVGNDVPCTSKSTIIARLDVVVRR